MSNKYFLSKMVLCSAMICFFVLALQPSPWGPRGRSLAGPVPEEPISDPVEFRLVADRDIMGAFIECSGIGSATEIVEFREGTSTGVSRKVAGAVKWHDIILTRRVSPDMAMWRWRKSVEDGQSNEAIVNGRILAINRAGDTVAAWRFINGWPSNIISDGRMEAVTITHEGIWREE
ncbi:MAG: phage tail protein [Planctomycetota bacterium]